MIVNVGNLKKINKSLVQSTAIGDAFYHKYRYPAFSTGYAIPEIAYLTNFINFKILQTKETD
jgi:hypothetical protein